MATATEPTAAAKLAEAIAQVAQLEEAERLASIASTAARERHALGEIGRREWLRAQNALAAIQESLEVERLRRRLAERATEREASKTTDEED